ncbi:hypothetical protein HanIR_Chr17g0892551 [Helianthus annuus]|nr:hypothetical protein HanIR_Chr17g0892551 [Helianthus annuus]
MIAVFAWFSFVNLCLCTHIACFNNTFTPKHDQMYKIINIMYILTIIFFTGLFFVFLEYVFVRLSIKRMNTKKNLSS